MLGSPPALPASPAPYRVNAAPAVHASPVRYPAIPSTSPAGPVIPLTPADSGH